MFIKIALNILELILLIYLGLAALYFFFFSVASKFPQKYKPINETDKKRRFAILIPGYKEDTVIINVAKEALNQEYPKTLYDIIIIADSFKENTLQELRALPIKVIEVSFEASTKSKALNKAMETLNEEYDVALILDADNIMKNDFLAKINCAFENGYSIIQGHRVAKNTNTSFAILDAISEEINNSIFRKGHRAVGLSSALIGSGMAFEYNFFKERMNNIKAIGGFDKELELTILRDGYKIEYLNDAIIYDEKVQKAQIFANQRKRWISAQLIYFRRFFFSGIYHLLKSGKLDFFDKVYQMISPPRILLFVTSGILFIFYFILEITNININYSIITHIYWGLVFVITTLALIIATPSKYWNKKTFRALSSLPKAVGILYKSLLNLKGANKKFIHTQHNS